MRPARASSEGTQIVGPEKVRRDGSQRTQEAKRLGRRELAAQAVGGLSGGAEFVLGCGQSPPWKPLLSGALSLLVPLRGAEEQLGTAALHVNPDRASEIADAVLVHCPIGTKRLKGSA